MSKPFIFPQSDEWYKTVRMISLVGSEDKADEWAMENDEAYDQYFKCKFCEFFRDGECHNLASNYAYDDVGEDENCDEWSWDED